MDAISGAETSHFNFKCDFHNTLLIPIHLILAVLDSILAPIALDAWHSFYTFLSMFVYTQVIEISFYDVLCFIVIGLSLHCDITLMTL